MIHHIGLDNSDELTIKTDLDRYSKGDHVVGSCVHEANDWEDIYRTQFEPFIRICKDKGLKYDIIINETYLDKPFRIPDCTPIVINFFAINTVWRIKEDGVKANNNWNSNAKKFLFLTGKADKIHRIGLLAALINNKLKKKMIWSFFPYVGTPVAQKSSTFLRMFSKDSYVSFSKKYERSPDSVEPRYSDNGSHYSGFPFDVSLYSNTLFSIVSESEFVDNTCVWQTEKTYKAIVNKHPFIIAGQLGSIERLKDQKFKTFEKYLVEPDYYKISNPKQRILSIAKNARHLVADLNSHVEQIQEDVEHNYKRLFELFDETIEKYDIFQDQSFYNNFFKDTSIKNA